MRIVVIMVLLRALAAAPLLLALTACSADGESGESGEGVDVVTSMYPLQFLAERVGGAHVDVSTLTRPGQEPHDLELGIPQTAALTEADLVVYSRGFQAAVDEAVEQNGPDRVVDAAEAADLRPADDHEHQDEAAAEGHEHEGEHDPHFWLDPIRMADVAAAVGGSLAEADPDHAADYEANVEQLREELEELDAQYRAGLADCATDTVVVSHDAFGYLAKYGLVLEPIAGLSPGADPSPAHLATLQELIGERGLTTVFSETLASPELADTLAHDLGLESAVLDPIEGLSDETADEDYLSLMRANLTALRTANGCG
jgi:zinc transport system substrate-binding protein